MNKPKKSVEEIIDELLSKYGVPSHYLNNSKIKALAEIHELLVSKAVQAKYQCYKDEQCWENLSDDRQRGIQEAIDEVTQAINRLFGKGD